MPAACYGMGRWLRRGDAWPRVWSHLKRSLANLAKRNIAQLTTLVKTRLKRMQYRPALLGGFLASTRLDLTPSVTPTLKDR